MVFGNASADFALGGEEDYVSERLYALSEELGRRDPANQSHGLLGGEWGYGQEYANEVFEMHPYWWGDCTCGHGEEEWKWDQAHQHAPNCFNTRYQAEDDRLHALDIPLSEGQELLIGWAKQNGYPDAPYGMAVYCDCGVAAAWVKWAETHQHAPDCREVLPNFRSGGVSVHWYKYIGRGMSANRQLSRKEWQALFKRCFDSLPS
jgi:hypothetical protein